MGIIYFKKVLGIFHCLEMKFNISDPTTGGNGIVEIEEEKYIRPFFDKRMGQEINGEVMGEQFKGYVFRITGGNDKQGFTMKQGILVQGRSRILFKKRGTTFRPRRTGEGKKKDQPVIITGKDHANRLGKKRRNNILKFYALDKKDDVRKYVVRRSFEKKTKDGEAITRKNGDKTFYKAPKVQRMITETKIRRKKVARHNVIDGIKNSQKKATDYEKLLKEYFAEKKEVKNTSKEKQASEVPRKQAA